MRGVLTRGYVTAVHLPDGFDVNGEHIVLQPSTTWGLEKDKATSADSPLKDDLREGAYVWVLGSTGRRVPTAETVLFRDDRNRRLDGFGPIDRVVSAGPQPVFSADGYPIRVVSSAQTSFHGAVRSLADVGANSWLHYEAKRGPDGILIATKADFVSIKPKRVKVVDGAEDVKLHFEAPDISAHKDGRVMLGVVGTWYPVPADRLPQEHVARIGMSLVPAFQRSLPDDDPEKIKFAFYEMEDKKQRGIICSPRGGVILIPKHLVDRMQNDDQLAAALAYAVASVLQRQGLANLMEQKRVLGKEIGTVGIYLVSPFALAVALDFAGALPDHQVQTALEEQRDRLALALMQDAGFDPWKAPMAFRLMSPKELPSDLNTLKHTDVSGYLLNTLNLQYRTGHDSRDKPTSAEASSR